MNERIIIKELTTAASAVGSIKAPLPVSECKKLAGMLRNIVHQLNERTYGPVVSNIVLVLDHQSKANPSKLREYDSAFMEAQPSDYVRHRLAEILISLCTEAGVEPLLLWFRLADNNGSMENL